MVETLIVRQYLKPYVDPGLEGRPEAIDAVEDLPAAHVDGFLQPVSPNLFDQLRARFLAQRRKARRQRVNLVLSAVDLVPLQSLAPDRHVVVSLHGERVTQA